MHQAIVEQQHVASSHVLRQAQVADADLVLVAGRRIGIGHQVEAIAHGQLDLAFGKTLDADLRTRQVGKDADFGADAGRSGTHFGSTLGLPGRVAVAEVEAHHVDARLEQRIQHTGRIR